MNLRGHAPLHHPGIQLAPLVDVLLLLLIFFPADMERGPDENELDVKVPKASLQRRRLRQLGTLLLT
jgi:biopolymer transport protein ExbD